MHLGLRRDFSDLKSSVGAMLVYGDRSEELDPRALLEEVARTRSVFDAGILAQGVADAACPDVDDLDDASARCLDLAIAAARKSRIEIPRGLRLPKRIVAKTPEGFAHYALLPCLVEEAARTLGPSVTVIGVRSIGTTLAAIVAAASGARNVFTVRPRGHPFARTLSVSDALAHAIARASRFAVVDEGPGLSGSSFGAVADFLEERGARDVVFLPSHDGDLGPHASRRHRERWTSAKKLVAPFSHVEQRLPTWFADLVDATTVEDLSCGAWRKLRYEHARDWPPSWTSLERRKYKLGPCLAEFVGLGRHGERAFARQSELARAGFALPPLALREGFMLTRFVEHAQTVRPTLDHVAAYLAFRARMHTRDDGASVSLLAEMARVNLREVGLEARVFEASDDAPRVAIDGRMQPWEWIGEGTRVWKTDAVQHAAAHDLVGAQPIAWDVAGALHELSLDRKLLLELLAREGVHVRDLDFYVQAYLAFRIGAWTMARASTEDEDERARIDVELTRAIGAACALGSSGAG